MATRIERTPNRMNRTHATVAPIRKTKTVTPLAAYEPAEAPAVPTPAAPSPAAPPLPATRWAGIVRPYRAEDVKRLRNTIRIEHTLADVGARRLWHLLTSREYV